MSFFDETKNAGLVLLIIALLGVVLAIVAVFALVTVLAMVIVPH